MTKNGLRPFSHSMSPADAGSDSPFKSRFSRKEYVARGGGRKEMEDAVLSTLRWLARHQDENGSWRPGSGWCKSVAGPCPPDDESEPLTAQEIRAIDGWMAVLGDESLQIRERATFELCKCRPVALDRLRRRLEKEEDPEVRERLEGAIETALCRSQESVDQLASLSLLAFLGAGYCHLSREVYDGNCFGEVVKKGLKWLINREAKAGRSLVTEALVAAALSEAYGLTFSTILHQSAQEALDRLAETFKKDLGPRQDSRGVALAAWAARAAVAAELQATWLVSRLERWAAERIRSASPEDRSALAALANVLALNPQHRDLLERVVFDIALSGPLESDPQETRALLTFAVFQAYGPTVESGKGKGQIWSAWNQAIQEWRGKQETAAKECLNGSWSLGRSPLGRVGASAWMALVFETPYRYPPATR